MSNSIAPGSSADVNVKVTALTTNPNVPAQYKTIILKKNLVNGVNTLTQAMMNQTNTKYVVKYDFSIGTDINIPNNCILTFDGGSINGNYFLNCINTIFEGSAYCFGNTLKISGTHNALDISWFGIIGNNSNNAVIFKSLKDRLVNTAYTNNVALYMSSDIILSEGDIILPTNTTILGNNRLIVFEADSAKNALLCLSQSNYLENLTIRVRNTTFNGICVLFDSQIARGGQFEFNNVSIIGQWYQDYNLTTGIGLKIIANNDGDYNASVSMCHIRRSTVQYAKIGIEVVCDNSVVRQDNRYAWMNEIYFDNIFITSKDSGVKTTLLDNTTHPTSVTSNIYFSHISHQAIDNDTPLFTHSGDWTIYFRDGYHYDSSILGRVFGGIVNMTNIGTDIINDSDGTDDYGTYKSLLAVRLYDDGKIVNNNFNIATLSSFVDSIGYNGSTGQQRFLIGSDENAFTIKRPQYKAIKWYNDNTSSFNKFNIKSYSKNYYTIIDTNSNTTVIYKLMNKDNKYIILDLKRYDLQSGFIAENDRTKEVYKVTKVLSDTISAGSIFKFKLKLNFQNNGTVINWSTYKALFNKVASLQYCFKNINIGNSNVIKSYYKESGEDLYLYIVCQAIQNIVVALITFDLRYQDELVVGTDIAIADNGEPTILRTADDYLYNVTADVENLSSDDKGICTFNSTKPQWWDGTQWIYADGTPVT